jgi:hypothetical protein
VSPELLLAGFGGLLLMTVVLGGGVESVAHGPLGRRRGSPGSRSTARDTCTRNLRRIQSRLSGRHHTFWVLLCLAVWAGIQTLWLRNVMRAETELSVHVAGPDVVHFTDPPSFMGGWFWVAGLLLVAVIVIWKTGFWRCWRFWAPEHEENTWVALSSAAVAVVVLIEAFAALTAMSAQEGWVKVSGFEAGDPPTQVMPADHPFKPPEADNDVHFELEELYVWNVLDALPGLKVPETLNWDEAEHSLDDRLGGGILLVFKLLVILPIVGVLVQYFRPKPTSSTEPQALGIGR